MEKAINQEYQMSNTKVATLPNNNHVTHFFNSDRQLFKKTGDANGSPRTSTLQRG